MRQASMWHATRTSAVSRVGWGGRSRLLGVLWALALLGLGTVPARAAPFCLNKSYITTCDEEDNVNVPIFGRVSRFRVVALHPTYEVGEDNCEPDFSGCRSAADVAMVQVADICERPFDDGISVVEVCTAPDWWRPYSMSVVIGSITATGHYLRLYRKIEGEDSWDQFLVLYEDGNTRLIPHPPKGRPKVCFGSSVIIGPAALAKRPYVDIQEVRVTPTPLSLDITYREGGAAHLDLSVNRSRAVAEVQVSYSTDNPFATFRSMWVSDGNADVDHIQNQEDDFPILGDWISLNGPWWFFHRKVRSRHNTSAPDIQIVAGPLPALTLTLTGCTECRTGDQLKLHAIVTPGPEPVTADAYVAVRLPDGTLLFLQGDGSFTREIRPIVRNWTVTSFSEGIFPYIFKGGEPRGSYAWLGAFTEPGTLNIIGGIPQGPFSFSP